MATWAELEAALSKQLYGERLAHVYRVVEAAQELSARFGAAREQAEVAALMHDYCRAMPDSHLLTAARQRSLVLDPAEEVHPILLHGPVAAALLQEQGLLTDPEVLAAIRWHTTGRASMTLLEKVIWLADYTEAGRSFPGAGPVRMLAQTDLDGALLLALEQMIAHVSRAGWPLHPSTIQARDWLLKKR